ncbi:C-C motif chemokine 3 [Meleagris gallopavo]|uniref:Chemokine interleukin-8-like domain-containing protein n=1 Tax=Meleagris gallopavo TaxID=9103 RepID=A0A803XT06_MELGA|nr:C-C motif chemokine 3 [Meleagris gallopavo]
MYSSLFLETLCLPRGWGIKVAAQQRPSIVQSRALQPPSSSPAHCANVLQTMKGPAAILTALLLLALCSSAVAHLDELPTTCCFSYVQRPIPRNIIKSAYITSSKCRLPAVILVTKKGKEICANPEESWVQNHLELFQNEEN